jgi:16S rRNA U1498 N3-methylase RsmE
MTTEQTEDEPDIAVPLTQEERLRKIAEATLQQCGENILFPIVSDWPEGPLQVFVSPAEMAAEHMPKTALAFVEFEHEGKPFIASLGAND